jgi:hypothetical protein
VLIDNNFAGNDLGEDGGNNPIIDSFINDALFTNSVTGNMCVALSNNLFQFNAVFQNPGAAANFQVELDGITNGITPATVGGNFLFPAFGSTCQGLLDAERLAFQAVGFPAN